MKNQQTHLASLFSFLLFLLGSLLLLSAGLVLGTTALTTFFLKNETDLGSAVFSAVLCFEGLVLLIAAVVSFLKFLNKPIVEIPMTLSRSNWQVALGVIGAGLALWIGNQVQNVNNINWLALPVLSIPAIALPLWAILGLGTRNSPPSSRWRTWSVFGLSMTLVPFILIILEIAIALGIFILVILYILLNPDLMAEIQRLSNQFMYIDPQSDKALELLIPLMTKPGVIAVILLYISLLIPMTEEIFKPLGVWLLNRKLNSPSQGFALGALSGAGYALAETANVSGQTAEWGSLLFMRIGTGLLHITTSALIGGAIIMAWHERRYLRLFGTYLLAVTLHGLWNTAAIAYGFSQAAGVFNQTTRFDDIQKIATVLLILLVISLLTIFLITSHKLREPVLAIETSEATPAEEPNDNLDTQ